MNDYNLLFIKKERTQRVRSVDYTVSARQMEYFNMDNVEEAALPLSFVPQDWASLYKNVAGALDGTEKLEVTPESVLRCFRVIEAAFRSSETGCSVAL